jgi:hypothetical protein
MKWRGDYVPSALLCMGGRGYGDYIILDIGTDGQIADWSFPEIHFEQWIHLENAEASIRPDSSGYWWRWTSQCVDEPTRSRALLSCGVMPFHRIK